MFSVVYRNYLTIPHCTNGESKILNTLPKVTLAVKEKPSNRAPALSSSGVGEMG